MQKEFVVDVRCRIELFGELRVTQGDQVHTRFRTHKSAALLAYLALYLHQTHSRERLLEVFWPDMTVEAGRDNLSTTLSQLRRQLEPTGVPAKSILIADHQQVRLNAEAVSTDVAEFDQTIRMARRDDETEVRLRQLQRAVELYKGELLPGNYEDWAVREQSRCQAAYLEVLRLLVADLEESDDLAGALAAAQRMVEADPYEEEAYQMQMRLYVRQQHPAAALEVYQRLKNLFKKEMGVPPSPETQTLAEQVRRDPRALLAARASTSKSARKPASPVRTESVAPPPEAPRPSTPAPAAPPLPLQLTRFFGRQREREELQRLLLTPGTRLVTLMGTGGVGKTRLSIAMAEQVAPAFQGRVWFVPLADLPDAGLIPYALVNALRLPPVTDADPFERAVEALQEAPSLLVLDNFEHLLREAPEPGKSDNRLSSGSTALVRMLLARVPELVVLVTSRQALRLGGEQEYPLSPLAVPSPAPPETPESLLTNDSIALYNDRARSAKPDFALTSNNAADVATLCRMLEGVPLAIEMAAAWAKTLPPQKMVTRLDQQLNLLVSRRRDLPLRHQSLRATIEWSYDFLEPELQACFAQLSVFRGGTTLEAAEAVCGEEALDHLVRLQEQSLIVAEEAGEQTRYRLLEPLREFAAEKLEEMVAEDARRRHRDWYLHLTERAGPLSQDQVAWLDQIEAEHDNFRAALDFCKSDPDGAEAGLQLARQLVDFWDTRGYQREGRERIAAALEHPQAAQYGLIYSRALNGAANMAWSQGDMAAAAALYKQSLALCRERQDRRGIALVLGNLGGMRTAEGDWKASRVLLEESLSHWQALGDQRQTAMLQLRLALVVRQEGAPAEAEALLLESLRLSRELGIEEMASYALGNLSPIARQRGDLEAGRAYQIESLVILRRLNSKRGIAYSLEEFAHLAQAGGDNWRAVCLDTASARLRKEAEIPLSPAERSEHDQIMAAARDALDQADFAQAWAAGQAMTTEQAMDYALSID
jgi:predicted ATPase/DNA-binding SARP family transcriptional activator